MACKNSISNGYILHEEGNIVIIATGFVIPSDNAKTGPMIQIWIIRNDMSPVAAVKNGGDSANCFNCKHRGEFEFVDGQLVVVRGRSCYVNVGQAPLAIYNAYKNGSYPRLDWNDYALYRALFLDAEVRLGAYGDPCLIPQQIVRRIVTLSKLRTGYTHQWRIAGNEWLREFVMASCDTLADYYDAKAAGWRTFRVTNAHTPESQEILCPSESRGRQCIDCGLCNGARAGVKDIYIVVHGSGASNAFNILQ